MEKLPKLAHYDGKLDLNNHVQVVNDHLNYFSDKKESKCKLFVLTLVDLARLWLNGLPHKH